MKVRLKSDWFAANGRLYRKGVHELPSDWQEVPKDGEKKEDVTYLPRTAEVLEKGEGETSAPKRPSPKQPEK